MKGKYPRYLVPQSKPRPKDRWDNILAADVNFALSGKMITKSEADACLTGDMMLQIQGRTLTNLNANQHVTPIKTGETVGIYYNRADDVHMNMLFDRPMPKH